MYLLACSVVMLVAMYQGLRAFIGAPDIRALHKRLNTPPIWLHMIPAGLMVAPVIASVFDELRLQSGQSIAISSGIINVTLALLGALIVLAATVIEVIRHRTQRNFGFSVRRLVLAASASLVLVSATSHLMFTRDAGTVLFDAFREEVNDMHCEASRILIRGITHPIPRYAIAAHAGICSIAMPACHLCLGRITAKGTALIWQWRCMRC